MELVTEASRFKYLTTKEAEAMYLWKYNKATGYWSSVREVTSDTAAQWLAIWQKAEPAETFKVSTRRPK